MLVLKSKKQKDVDLFMKRLLQLISWKKCFVFTFSILPFILIFSFYGLYTNKFYFLKIDNYIFSFLVIVHLIFLNTLRKAELDAHVSLSSLRNLEFIMYAIVMVYLFKLMETTYILSSYLDYSEQVFPPTFLPLGILIFTLQSLLIILTFATFRYRRERIGPYGFDRINEL